MASTPIPKPGDSRSVVGDSLPPVLRRPPPMPVVKPPKPPKPTK